MDTVFIPADYRTLIALLRCAVNRRPPDNELYSVADWEHPFRLARQHRVETFLYPWLAQQFPKHFSKTANVPVDSAPAVWRSLFLQAIPQTVLRQRQLDDLLCACESAKIDVIPLKGCYLSEVLYDTPVQRSMSDMDLLVREQDCDRCHALFLSLGYRTRNDTLHNPYAKDQAYYHPQYPCFVELHWNFSSKTDRLVPSPDVDALWQAARLDNYRTHAVLSFSMEDQFAHLVQHLLHHRFAVPLRAYVDLALFLLKHGSALSSDVQFRIAERWRLGSAVPFVVDLVVHLFELPEMPHLHPADSRPNTTQVMRLLNSLFSLQPSDVLGGETTLSRYRRASFSGRLALLAQRVFIPQACLALRYPCARYRVGLPLAWLLRVRDLSMFLTKRSRALARHTITEHANLADFETRETLVQELLGKKKSE